ncbi:HCR019Cp [Eremothecium sinecaudum]|uniref:HCR019Cp n=1 Tax=Eremothecium sinecaudum TaxID=45286 RepID=A0A0X8HRM6_9SACH|nr:HCR019Cp [Eremothecium sinecaudum]AMD20169.1 HCR019Cp [Eremothecium sinecaudum]
MEAKYSKGVHHIEMVHTSASDNILSLKSHTDGTQGENSIDNESLMNNTVGMTEGNAYSIDNDSSVLVSGSKDLRNDILSLDKRETITKGEIQSISPQEKLERQRAMRRKRDNAYRARKRAAELTIDPDMEQFFAILNTVKESQIISVKYDAASLSMSLFPRVLLNKSDSDEAALYKSAFDNFIEIMRTKIRSISGIKLSKERTSVHVTSISCVLYCSQDKSHQRLVQSKDVKKTHSIGNFKQYHCQSYMRVNYSFKTHILSIKFRHIKHQNQQKPA